MSDQVKLVIKANGRLCMEKAKKMPIGTISRGYKKVAEGKWVPVKHAVAKEKLSGKWARLSERYGVSEEIISAVRKKGYSVDIVDYALNHMSSHGHRVTRKEMKELTANRLGGMARQAREDKKYTMEYVEHQAQEAKKMKKSKVALFLIPGELSKAAKLSNVGASHPAGLSNVQGETKSKIPYSCNVERMKLAKMAMQRMLGASTPENEKKHADNPTVDRKGREKGEKPPYTGYAQGVSGMGSQAHDNFARPTIIVKPSEIGTSVPEGPTKHTPVKHVRKPKK